MVGKKVDWDTDLDWHDDLWLRIFIEMDIAVNYDGSQARFADENGLSRSYVGDVLKGRRAAGRKILDAVGIEKVVRYRLKPE